MSYQTDSAQSTQFDEISHHIRFVGGTTAVTKLFGLGVAVTYVSTGVVNLVWAENPGTYLGVSGYCFDATTASALKGYTLVPGAYNSVTRTMVLNIFNSSFAAADLAALQNLTLRVVFRLCNA